MIWLVNNWRNLIIVGLIALNVTYSALFDHYRTKAKEQSERADHAEELAEARQKTITNMLARQRDVAALDAKYTKELADAKAENDALQRKLDNGGRVLVKGNCSGKPKAATTPGVDDVGTVELSSTAGRNVLSIRQGIQRDQAALRGLQQYIREQCLK